MVSRYLLLSLFFIMLAAEPLGVNVSLAPGLSVKNAFLYVILIGISVDTALKRNRNIELLPVIVPYALLFFYAVLTIAVIILFLDYPRYRILPSLISLKGLVAENLLVFLIFFYGVLSPKDALSACKMMIWIIMLANIISVLDALNIPNFGLIDERDDGRIGGFIGESNQFAAFLALFLPGIVALTVVERGVLRFLAFLGIAATLLALLMTASRGGFLAVIAGSAAAAVFLRRHISGTTVMTVIGAMTVFAIAAIGIMYATGYGDLLYNRVIGDSTAGNSFDVSSGRSWIWGTTVRKMLEQPVSLITGFGWDAYFQSRDFRFAPHNSYLKVYFELGVIGLMLVLLSFVNILRLARVAFRNADSETATMLFAFVFGFFSILIALFFVDVGSTGFFLWAFAGIAMRLAVLNFGEDSTRIQNTAVLPGCEGAIKRA